MINITFLGTGSSDGVPLIGCHCPTCVSSHPRNRRLRASLLIESATTKVLIDASSDFRYQALKYNIHSVDAIFFTHADADHISGIPDLRAINWRKAVSLPIYAEKHHTQKFLAIDVIYHQYQYAFNNEAGKCGRPSLMYHNIKPNQIVHVGDLNIEVLRVMHGSMPILAFRIERFAYLTDVSAVPEETVELLKNQLDVLVLNAVGHHPSPRHLHLDEAIKVAHMINAKHTYFTHMSHDMEYESVMQDLPDYLSLAYDGLVLTLDKE